MVTDQTVENGSGTGFLQGPMGEYADTLRVVCSDCGEFLGRFDNTESNYRKAEDIGGAHISEHGRTPCWSYDIYAEWGDHGEGGDYRVH